MTVTSDPYSRKYCPATAAEWTEMLSGTGLNVPSSFWKCNESSGSLADSGTGGRTVTIAGSPTYAAAAPGWQRTGIKCADGSTTQYGSFTIPNVNANSSMLLQMFATNTAASADRFFNLIGGSVNSQFIAGTKLRNNSGANTADGEQQQAGTVIVITKLDRANSVAGTYTKWEQIKATWSAPGANTTAYLLGNGGGAASDATLVYAAYWTGSDAEISDSAIQTLLTAIYGSESTSSKMQSGSFAMKWVATIEGCPYVPTDAPAAAVINAYAGTDWTDATKVLVGSLRVDMQYEQSVEPLNPFASMGKCTLLIQDTDGTDTFGKHVARRQGGNETTTTATVDRNDTALAVRSTLGFASSGTAYIGTEAFSYSGVAAQSFTVSKRGLYSPFGCATSGSGGTRFANHHRVGSDINHVQRNPVVSSIPRQWIGKRVAVRLHTWDAANNAINSWREAQLVWAGRISGISEDKNQVGITKIEVDHEMSYVSDTVIGRDQFAGELTPGLYLVTGRTITFWDKRDGVARKTANALTVVAGAPASANEMTAGYYSLSELCDAINKWLGAEKAAARIDGMYTWSSPVSTNDGVRSRCVWNNTAATTAQGCGFSLGVPSEVAAFLGLTDADPTFEGQTVNFQPTGGGPGSTTNVSAGAAAPFTSLTFKPSGPGSLGQEFASSAPLDVDNVRGAFIDQYADLPASVKAKCDSSAQWGIFLFDEKIMLVGRFDSTTNRISNCWIAPFKFAANDDKDAMNYIGRRADEPDAGPVLIRQVFVLEGTKSSLFLQMLYSTGVAGYNHADYDTLGAAFGLGLPGALANTEFENELTNLPNSNDPRMILIDEGKRFSEIWAGELNFIWAFLRWKDGHFGIAQWRTPLNAYAVTTLDETNKADASPGANHRVASEETDEFRHSVIKIDYCRDFGFNKGKSFHRSFQFEDQTAVDDAGGSTKVATIELPNTFDEFANTGSSIEAGLPQFMAHMPSISAASRRIARTMDHRYFEMLAPGDIVTVDDDFARDPLTGARGVLNRAAFVTSVHYDLGGPTGDPGNVRPIAGEIRLHFLDTQRGSTYAPAAEIDSTVTGGGFSAGYNSGTKTLRCVAHSYSHVITLPDLFGAGTRYISESNDAQSFVGGDFVDIIEIDPSNTASPVKWQAQQVASQSGNDLVLVNVLPAPAWDATKLYRITPAAYLSTQVSQREAVFQADATDEMVQDTEIPWHYSVAQEDWGASDNTAYDAGEFVADVCYGDGRPYDVGTERAIARTINAYTDNVTAHSAPFLARSPLAPSDTSSSAWQTLFVFQWFLGTEQLSATIKRYATVAPWFRSSSAGLTGSIRVTIMNQLPVKSADQSFDPGQSFRNPLKTGAYQVTPAWSSTSTTWGQGADATLDLSGVKDIFFGHVWVLVEGTGHVECRGLSRLSEGPRGVEE